MEKRIIKRICVNCGSSPGLRPEYTLAARELGHLLAKNNIDLIYGGGNLGLMGELAETVIQSGGAAVGIVPRFIADRLSHEGLTEIRLVDSMHERKQMMFDLADGFIALPGGMGTLEEILELLTWTQLGLHQKPCGILNVCGYYNLLFGFLDFAVSQLFIKQEHRDMVLIDSSPDKLLNQMLQYQAPNVEKWIGLKRT